MSGFPYIFTFYSYKGGVGRSMALLNTAYALAGRGRQVLVIDADLEAPGVSEFLRHTSGELGSSADMDVVDLLSWAFAAAGSWSGDAEQLEEILAGAPPLGSYAAPAPDEQIAKVAPRIGWTGHLDFITAAPDRDYFSRLEDINLPGRQREELMQAGEILRAYLKSRRVEFRFPGLEQIEGPEQVPYDYVLVDSRTGLSETGGLCVGPLADRLVVLTALNDQNVIGTERFLKFVGAGEDRSDQERPWDEADVPPTAPAAPPRRGPKPTLVVASPLPAGELDYKKSRLAEVSRHIGKIAATLSYHPRMAVAETIFVRDWKTEYLAIEYQALADQMMASIDDHATQLAPRSSRLWNEENRKAVAVEAVIRLTPHQPDLGEQLLRELAVEFEPTTDEDYRAANRLYGSLCQEKAYDRHVAFSRWGDILTAHAKANQGKGADTLYNLAFDRYEQAVRLKPDNHKTLNNWGVALAAQAMTKQGDAADALFQLAYSKYEQAVRLSPGGPEPLSNWGNALSGQARIKQGEAADVLFREAYGKYEQAVRISPRFSNALLNWGNALGEQARTKQKGAADALFQEAYDKYEQAVGIKPDFLDALVNWGAVLGTQARTKKGDTADALFLQAYGMFEKAVQIKPDLPDAFARWGAILSDQAKTKQGDTADRLFQEAYGKFEKALLIKPTDGVAINAWGATLLNQARTKEGPAAIALLREAGARLTHAEEIEEGAGSYNLACASAVEGDRDRCRRWLEKARLAGRLPKPEAIQDDPDLQSVRELPWFREFIEQRD